MPSEYVARWSGGRIGSGASVFHFQATSSPSQAQAAAIAVRAFFQGIVTLIPSGIAINFDPEVRVLAANGTLENVIAVTAPVQVTGSGTGSWSNGTGAMIRWNTNSVIGGRRLLGRTFIVPMRGSAFVGGNLDTAPRDLLVQFGNNLLTDLNTNAGGMQVWSRKNNAVAQVASVSVPARPSSLRTRNDRA